MAEQRCNLPVLYGNLPTQHRERSRFLGNRFPLLQITAFHAPGPSSPTSTLKAVLQPVPVSQTQPTAITAPRLAVKQKSGGSSHPGPSCHSDPTARAFLVFPRLVFKQQQCHTRFFTGIFRKYCPHSSFFNVNNVVRVAEDLS